MRVAWAAVISSGTPPGTSPQHGVEPARGLVLGPAQVPVPPGPHPQHRAVVIGGHQPPGLRPQRRDPDRRRVIRVLLISGPRGPPPHPGTPLPPPLPPPAPPPPHPPGHP